MGRSCRPLEVICGDISAMDSRPSVVPRAGPAGPRDGPSFMPSLGKTLKAAVHWERPGCALAQSSPNLTLAAMGLRADSARPQRVSCSARTDSRRAESARNPIASYVKFGDDSALNALTRNPVDGGL